jgi:hypothetical protein
MIQQMDADGQAKWMGDERTKIKKDNINKKTNKNK